jgi:hypothetical protein
MVNKKNEIPKKKELSQGEIEKNSLKIMKQVKTIEIKDKQSFDRGNAALLYIKEVKKRIKEIWDPMIKKSREALKKSKEALKEIQLQQEKLETPYNEAYSTMRKRLSDYMDKEEEKRKQIEKERAEKIEEAKRLEAEALKKAEKKEKISGIKKIFGKDAKIDNSGSVPAIEVPFIPESPEKLKVSGVMNRTNWKFEIQDASRIPREFMKPDEVKIGQHVRKEKNKAYIPGVRVFPEKSF